MAHARLYLAAATAALTCACAMVQAPQAQILSYAHVKTNAALKAISPTFYPNGVWRDGVAAQGDAPPLLYTYNSGACSLNAGAGDNGSQVAASGGGCWIAVVPEVGFDVREFGNIFSDIGAPINACVTASPTGNCLIPVYAGAEYPMTTPVVVANGAAIRGPGHGGEHDISPFYTAGCMIKWTGAAAATMFTFTPASTGGSATRNEQGGITGCGLDGNNDNAAIGVLLQSTFFADIDVYGQHFSTAVFESLPVAASPGIGEGADVQHDDVSVVFNQAGNSDGSGLILDGIATANTSFLNIQRVMGYYKNADGFVIKNADNNDIWGQVVEYQSAGGSATAGVLCAGNNTASDQTCRFNRFHGGFSVLPVTGYGLIMGGTDATSGSYTHPSLNNQYGTIDDSNGTTYYVGTGACGDFIKDLLLFHNFCGSVNISGNVTSSGTIEVNLNTAAAPPDITGTIFHQTQADTTPNIYLQDSAGNSGSGSVNEFIFRRSGGTIGSPTDIVGPLNLGIFGGAGYDGTSYTGLQGYMAIGAIGTWSPTSHPTDIGFNVTAIGSTTEASAMTIDSNGHLYFSSQIALGNSPTCGTGCASVASSSTDNNWSIVTGSGVTAETINFGTAWPGTTFTGCTITVQGATPTAVSYTVAGSPPSSITVNNASLTGATLTGNCF